MFESFRLYLDQMLRLEVAEALRAEGHDVLRASETGHARADDDKILQRAIAEGRILVTHDEHFGDWVILPLHEHPGVIRLKVNPATSRNITELLVPFLRSHSPQEFRNLACSMLLGSCLDNHSLRSDLATGRMGGRFQAEEKKAMKCAACHGEMVTKKGEIDFRIEGKLYLARNVLYEECKSCGEKVLSPEVSQKLFEKIKRRDFVEERVKLPVLEGTYG